MSENNPFPSNFKDQSNISGKTLENFFQLPTKSRHTKCFKMKVLERSLKLFKTLKQPFTALLRCYQFA